MNHRKLHLLMLLLLAIFTFIVNNGALEANIMEARNLTTAREMLEKGNWFAPTMNGELRLEKPPFPTWTAAITMIVFGQNNLSLLRLPSALAAILLVFFIFRLTEELTDDEKLPLIAAGTAATSFYIFFMSRDISWDIFCHSFMIGAIWQLHRGLKKGNLANFIIASLLMGFSFLSKGPVSFYALLLPYLIATTATSGTKPFSDNCKPLMLLVIITLIISAAWPIYIYFSHPEYSTYVAQKESGAWLTRNVKPFYYYWSFPIQSGIWAIFATIALIFPYARKRIEQFGSYKFLAIWVWSAVILLSLFPEKKERYLLPILLPLAIITAFYFRYLIRAFKNSTATKSDTILFSINGWLMSIVSFVLPIAIWVMIKNNGRELNPMLTIATIILFWALALFLGRSIIQKKPFSLWIGMVLIIVCACGIGLGEVPKIIVQNPQYRPYYKLRHNESLKTLPFFKNDTVDGKFIEVVWASGHEIKSWFPRKTETIPAELPFVLFSAEKPTAILDADFLGKYDIEELGLFDANIQQRWGGDALKNYVTIIKQKK